MSLGVGGAKTGATENATLLWGHFPGLRALRPGPGPPHPKAGEARGLCETPAPSRGARDVSTHILPTCTEGHQPPGPGPGAACAPGRPTETSCPGGRSPGVITATRKGRGAGRLRNSEEDRTRSRASLRASRASERARDPRDPYCSPTPFPSRSVPECVAAESPQASPSSLSPAHIHTMPRSADAPKPTLQRGSQPPPLVSSSPRTPHRSPDTLPSRPQERAFFSRETTWKPVPPRLCSRSGPALPSAGPQLCPYRGSGSREPTTLRLAGLSADPRSGLLSLKREPPGPASSWFYRGVSGPGCSPRKIAFPEWR